ncbi:MAG: MFS transporter [Chloroflexi bacterium]|nr:MFS transporter [Chloroflexota bacterium]
MNLFKSLSHRPFALLWSGQTISRFGDSLYRIALAWWVLEKTGSAAQMGIVVFFSLTPMIIFLLIGGVVVDRLPRLRVMLSSDLLSGLVISVVAFLAYTGQLELWHIYIASLLFGFVEAFFFPAYSAAVPEITPSEMLPSANSLTDLSRQLTGMIGPSIGAVIVAVGGTPLAFALDALSFFTSAICVSLIRHIETTPSKPSEPQHIFADLREGFSLVFSSSWLWITILVFAFINVTANGPFSVAMPLLVKQNLHADVGALGLIQTLFSIGSIVGAVWLGRFARLRRRGAIAYVATLVTGIAALAIGFPITIIGVGIASFARGVGFAIFGLIWTNTVQELVPREKLGRVFSIDALGSFVLMPLGFAGVGVLADQLGAPMVFILGGTITIFLTLLALLHPAIRNLD